MTRVGIFGGSFDPVHNGHLIMAVEALEKARLDELLVVPARVSPHKQAGARVAGEVRASLLEAAFAELPKTRVDRRELSRDGLSFTVDTLRELRNERPDDDLFFLIGADSLPDLPKWREIEALAELCTFLVARRPGWEVETDGRLPLLPLDGTSIGISSTVVRERARSGLPLTGYVPESVALRIESEGLYRHAAQ